MRNRKIENCRNEHGYINLDKLKNYIEKGEIVEGSYAKGWYNTDGVRFLFKEYNDVLPCFGEVLYSCVANKCGVKCAEYDFAIKDGRVGTISYDFLDEHKAYYNFLELTTQFCETNFTLEEIMEDKDLLRLQNNKYNNVVSICGVLEDIFNISQEERDNIELELVKMLCLDILFLHEDRRLWNYGVVVDESSDTMTLAPSHDNSHVLCLQKGKKYIESSIYSLIKGDKAENVINQYCFVSNQEYMIEQLVDYYVKSGNEIREKLDEIINNLNVDEEIENLTKICKIDEVSSLWIKGVINYRQSTILNILESAKIGIEDEPKRPKKTFNKKK